MHNIRYTDNPENIEPEMLQGFFVGWPKPPTPEKHLEILKNSYAVVLAVDENTEQVVGFINAVGDGILCAYLPLLEVLPEYQKCGIGGELVQRMVEKLNRLYMIDLVCDESLVDFYRKHGLKPHRAMMIRNFDRQSGEA
nr:GNAT family N-acetyltransferase [candidate division Zixibacteria bacterium]